MAQANLRSTYPTGWALLKLFVDVDGNVFKKGKEFVEEKGNFPVSVVIRKDGTQAYPPAVIPPEPIETKSKEASPEKEKTPEEKEEVGVLLQQNLELNERLSNLEQLLMSKSFGSTIQVREEKPAFGVHDSKGVEPGDFTPKRVRYFMFGRGYAMGSYLTREGKIETSPYNVTLYFKKSFDEVRHIEGNNRVIPFCEYSTNSKKEMLFIEGHPLYGIMIYQNHESAVASTENDNIVKLESIVNKFQAMSKMELFSLANQHNIDINADISDIRNKLVWIEVSKEVVSEKNQQAIRRGEVEREKELFKTE